MLSKTNLYIRGLAPHTTDQDLVQLCQRYGTIVSTKAIIDPETQQCKGVSLLFIVNLFICSAVCHKSQLDTIEVHTHFML